MPETKPKDWHEDETQTPLCEPDKETEADELAGDEIKVNEWGEEDADGYKTPLGVDAL